MTDLILTSTTSTLPPKGGSLGVLGFFGSQLWREVDVNLMLKRFCFLPDDLGGELPIGVRPFNGDYQHY